MFVSKEFNYNSLTTLLIIVSNQHFMFSAAQSLDFTVIKENAEQLATKLWTKASNTSFDSVVNQYSDALQSVQQSVDTLGLTKALSISCYECNSYLDPDCVTHPEKFVKNCTDAFFGSIIVGCRKIDQWVDYDGTGELKAHHRVIRQCAANGDISKPCYYRAGYGGRQNTCFCDKDLCNTGLSLKAANIEILFVITFALLLFICK